MHAVLAHPPLWKGAAFVSANPGLENEAEQAARRAADAEWAVKCLSAPWEDFLREWDALGIFRGEEGRDRSLLKPWRRAIDCAERKRAERFRTSAHQGYRREIYQGDRNRGRDVQRKGSQAGKRRRPVQNHAPRRHVLGQVGYRHQASITALFHQKTDKAAGRSRYHPGPAFILPGDSWGRLPSRFPSPARNGQSNGRGNIPAT